MLGSGAIWRRGISITILASALGFASPQAWAARPRTLELVSNSYSGGVGNDSSYAPSVSADGRFVAFQSSASDLVPDDTNGVEDIFVRDRTAGTTQRVSTSTDGVEGDGSSFLPTISDDGRVVAFYSYASTLIAGDSNQAADVFIHDMLTGITERVSLSSAGEQSDADSYWASLSDDGKHVAFVSAASSLVPEDNNGVSDTFVHDLTTGITERVSMSSSGLEGTGDAQDVPSISADGSVVSFVTSSALVPNDTNGTIDVFVRDRLDSVTERVSVNASGEQATDASFGGSLSADGDRIAFNSFAELTGTTENAHYDVYVRIRSEGVTKLISRAAFGDSADGDSYFAAISSSGSHVVFQSRAGNLQRRPDQNAGACLDDWPPEPPPFFNCDDIFLGAISTGSIELISKSGNQQANSASGSPAISKDARYIAFDSGATNLVDQDTNGAYDVFLVTR